MKIKTYCALIVICISVFFCSCGSGAPPVERPADFNFVIEFDLAFSVDTYESTLTETDLHTQEVAYRAEFQFTDEQMDNIYAEFLKLDIHKIKDGADVGKIQAIPPVGVYFTYTLDGKEISILCSDNNISGYTHNEKRNFVEFTDFVISYITDSEQYENAPQNFYGVE